MHIHQDKSSQSVLSYGCCSKLILEQGEPHNCGKNIFAMKYSCALDAEAMEPNAYHKAKDLKDDGDASLYGHKDSFKVELRIVFQDVKAMKEHKVDIKVSTITGIVFQDRETNLIVETRWYHVGQSGIESSSRTLLQTYRMRYIGIELRRDHWLVALQSSSADAEHCCKHVG